VDFVPEIELCPSCSEPLKVYKTRTKVVVTLEQGEFEAREVLKHCGTEGCPVLASRTLSEIVPRGQRYGWDLIAHVGMARYLREMQREEIRVELRERYGIKVSQATVSNLCDRFLSALGALHERRAPDLRAAMSDGYWLHLDATCDRGKGGLFVCLDGWRGWVLLAARIPSESGESLRPLVAETVARFGDPIATVRDLGEAGASAVAPLRDRGIPDLLCHFHFLSAVGKKLFDKAYSRLRDRLRALRIKVHLREILAELRRYRQTSGYSGRFGTGEVRDGLLAAVLWAIDGDGTKPPSYPFSLPLLDHVKRCLEVVERAQSWLPGSRSDVESAVIRMLHNLASSLRQDQSIIKAAQQLEEGWAPFCELRDLLRLTGADLSSPDESHVQQLTLPELELFRLRQLERALADYGIDLRDRLPPVGKKRSGECPQAILLDYLDRYGSGLVGHPAIRDPDGTPLAVVDRTNNPAERFFSFAKQSLRRRVGRALLGRDMELQPAQAALVPNLLLPDYVRVLCGSLDNLPRALADANPSAPRPETLVRTKRDAEINACLRALLAQELDQHSPDVRIADLSLPHNALPPTASAQHPSSPI
jgi:hypothetical protein